MIKKWKTLGRKEVARTPVFGLDAVRRDPPFDAAPADFYVVDLPDWVNVFAYTEDGELLIIRQYRHGTDDVTLEVPGGAIDAGEDALEGAKRELFEETGFRAAQWHHVGCVDVNPAIQNNRCHSFVALEAYRAGEPEPDEFEDIELELMPAAKLPQLIASGEIAHSLVIAGAYYVSEFFSLNRPSFKTS